MMQLKNLYYLKFLAHKLNMKNFSTIGAKIDGLKITAT